MWLPFTPYIYMNKHIIVNTSKSEVVHFSSAGENVPVFDVGGATLHHKDSFRYLGMVGFLQDLEHG